jgi:hypothetical protein
VTSSFTLQDFDRELWLAEKLGVHFGGSTTFEQRRERISAEIMKRKLSDRVCARAPHRKPVTFAQCFERVYGSVCG